MKVLILFLTFFPLYANAVCLDFYYDKNGQSHSVRCNSGLPQVQCRKPLYWDGYACSEVEIIKSCENQGGNWKEVQLRTGNMRDKNAYKQMFVNMCVCPNNLVWDGKICRNDVPKSDQCTNFLGDGSIRMTKEFFGNGNCTKVK